MEWGGGGETGDNNCPHCSLTNLLYLSYLTRSVKLKRSQLNHVHVYLFTVTNHRHICVVFVILGRSAACQLCLIPYKLHEMRTNRTVNWSKALWNRESITCVCDTSVMGRKTTCIFLNLYCNTHARCLICACLVMLTVRTYDCCNIYNNSKKKIISIWFER